MMRHLLALCLAVVPVSALAAEKVTTCNLPNNDGLKNKLVNRTIDSFFKSGDKEIKTLVRLDGTKGRFERQGIAQADTLPCVRYLSVDEAINFASNLNAPGLDVQNYFDTSACEVVIAADWKAGNSRGRVLWCAPLYSSGAEVKGVYWQNTDWEDGKFTDLWDGRWQ